MKSTGGWREREDMNEKSREHHKGSGKEKDNRIKKPLTYYTHVIHSSSPFQSYTVPQPL